MTEHSNDERTVRCPVKGCDATPLARGINLHIRRTSGGGHGPQGDVPEHLNLDNLETIGVKEVEMDYPDERDTETHARLCPYCERPFRGKHGVMIHLGQTAGRKNHPANPKERHEPGDFPRVEVDEKGNVERVVDPPATVSATGEESESLSPRHVHRLLADLMAAGHTDAVHRVRRALLGHPPTSRELRENLPHDDLFLDLVIQSQAPESGSVWAVLEAGGIIVACRGESAFYTAEEAREAASGLELATSDEYPHEEITDLIEFLRYGADVLEGDPGPSLHEEFDGRR